jgi:phosphoribosylanthranilate isomerase
VSPTRIKICGITRAEDARAAAEAGADAIGLVFYDASPRAVDAALASEIIAELPPYMTAVGLFVDAPIETIEQVLKRVPLDMLQFHGDETAAQCAAVGRPWYKALRMQPGEDIARKAAEYTEARAVLLDSFKPGVPGGTGEAFDWTQVPPLPRPLILAGGLDPDNVASAVMQVAPPAVDVSGGVERAPGLKDPELIEAFCAAVRAADEQRVSSDLL